jgi:hypothetical protein
MSSCEVPSLEIFIIRDSDGKSRNEMANTLPRIFLHHQTANVLIEWNLITSTKLPKRPSLNASLIPLLVRTTSSCTVPPLPFPHAIEFFIVEISFQKRPCQCMIAVRLFFSYLVPI